MYSFRICGRVWSCRLCIFLIFCVIAYIFLLHIFASNRKNLSPLLADTISYKYENVDNFVSQKRIGEVLSEITYYVLLWPNSEYYPFDLLAKEDVFIENECPFTNCHVTANKDYFGGDLSLFHAIAFNGRLLDRVPNLPRWSHQKFIYYNTESSGNYPLKDKTTANFYNWTSTYRLDSDIPFPYIMIKDSTGKVVGPKAMMKWKENMSVDVAEVDRKIKKKDKAAVAFVSNCKTRSKREDVLNQLQASLKARGHVLDVYGRCGTKNCSRALTSCDSKVEEYYFYLSFENSFSVDYVTEKLLRALNNDAVPVVLGGADYSRFLPPGSYLNLRDYSSSDELADVMVGLMKNPDRYRQFFSWQKYYTYHEPVRESLCALCEALNNKTKYETTTIYHDMLTWWNGS